jgi:hypothetical protein
MTRFVLALAVGWLAAASAFAEPPAIDRTIGKEPAYRTKAPKYGLLAFGPEGKDRVWLVLDGDTLYVDRNGNGDLTDPGEKVAAEKKPSGDPERDGYVFDVGDLTVGGRTHKGLRVYFAPLERYAAGALGKRPDVQALQAKKPKAMLVSLAVDVEIPGMKGGGTGGRIAWLAGPIDLTGVFVFADRPAEAPVVRLGGPLEITFYGEQPALRVGRESEFALVVGTPGIGSGTFAMVGYQGTIPEGAKPVAELSLPAARPGAGPVKEKFEIKGRC